MKMKLFQNLHTNFVRAEQWKPEMFAQFRHVANITIDSYCREIYDVIEEAFSIHNGFDWDEERIERLDRQHSMSVGDIVLFDGVHYMVDGWGFTPVEVFDGSRWYYK